MKSNKEKQFEYARFILFKVSFDKFIMAKEFFKFLRQFDIHQRIQLKDWIKSTFKLRFYDLFLIVNSNTKYKLTLKLS